MFRVVEAWETMDADTLQIMRSVSKSQAIATMTAYVLRVSGEPDSFFPVRVFSKQYKKALVHNLANAPMPYLPEGLATYVYNSVLPVNK